MHVTKSAPAGFHLRGNVEKWDPPDREYCKVFMNILFPLTPPFPSEKKKKKDDYYCCYCYCRLLLMLLSSSPPSRDHVIINPSLSSRVGVVLNPTSFHRPSSAPSYLSLHLGDMITYYERGPIVFNSQFTSLEFYPESIVLRYH